MFRNRKVLISVILIITSLNSIQWNKTYLIYELYWYKQSALVFLFGDNQFIRNNDTFAFLDIDQTAQNSSIYAYYGFAGILKRAYGNERRLILKEYIFKTMQSGEGYNKDYILGDYTGDYSRIDGLIIFESDLTLKDIPVLRYYDFIQSNLFETILRQTNRIKVVKNTNN